MPQYRVPKLPRIKPLRSKHVYLIASGDLRETANKVCWKAQSDMETALTRAITSCDRTVVRAHPFKPDVGHGFISSQREGMDVFASLDSNAPLIVAEAVWQYSHHVLAGLESHKGPILTVANWSGTWPGLVGMLNLNGSLTKAGVAYSTLWSEDFTDAAFLSNLRTWLTKGSIKHKTPHVRHLSKVKMPVAEQRLGEALAAGLRRNKAIMGVFDEGCMGMFNAIIPDHLLHPTGVYKERLNQSALHAAALAVPDTEARAALKWLIDAGMQFSFGANEATDLTESQVLLQCKMYIAALRIAEEFGCDTIGIQYQQGLKDCLPASDLAEGMLNDSVRPPVRSHKTGREIAAGSPLPHFNEVDECAGLDGLITLRVQRAMSQPVESTLHDLRWGDWDRSGTTAEYVWVFEISGSAPPSHFIGGWRGASGERQPPMYFRLGGSTIKGISKPGEIVWSRIYVAGDRLHMDIGRAGVIELPMSETRRRWNATTPQWPIMHAVLYGIDRDQMMAKHQANHIQVVYSRDAASADKTLFVKAAMAKSLGITVNVCGTTKAGKKW